jgi:translation elongation factor EF-1alpha
MAKKKRSLDSIIEEFEDYEKEKRSRRSETENTNRTANKIQVGRIEQFFDKINVAAVKLSDPLDIGDIIEIGSEDEAIRQRVESIEIDKKSVSHAEPGDSIGIKLKWKVSKGDNVYKMVNLGRVEFAD